MKRWMDHEVFRNMDIRKQTMIKSLSEALDGRELSQALPIVMEWRNQMQRENITFTQEENRLLTEMLSQQLTPAQRQQYEYLKRFITPRK